MLPPILVASETDRSPDMLIESVRLIRFKVFEVVDVLNVRSDVAEVILS